MKYVNVNKQRQISIILSYVSMAISFVIAMVYTPYALKCMGQSEYGNYHYISSIVSYLSLLTCGFGSAYLRFATPYKMKGDEKGVANINGLFLSLFVLMGTIALAIGAVMVWKSDWVLGGKLTAEELATGKILLIILVANLFATFPISIFNSYVIAQEQFVFQKCLALISSILNHAISFLVLAMGYKAIGVATATFVVTLIINSTTVVFCIKKLKMRFGFKLNNLKQAKEVFIFSSFLLLSMIVDQINWSVDKFLLGKLCGTAAVAIYTLGATINTHYKSIGDAISNVFVPEVYKILSKENGDHEATMLMTRIGRIQMIVLGMILSGFIVLGQNFISLWVGNGYEESYYVILLLLIPVTIPEIQKIGLEIQKAKNLHKFRSVTYTIISVVNLFISIPLSMRYGAVGAAAGTAITVLIGNGLIMNIYYHRVINVDMAYFWKQILKLFPSIALSIIAGISIVHILNPQSWGSFVLSGGIFALLFVGLLYLMGLNQYEKAYLKKITSFLKK